MTQEDHQRVSAKIAPTIIEFFKRRGPSAEFHLVELVSYVLDKKENTSPASPSVVLRALRRSQKLDYIVISRSESLYRITSTGVWR